MPKTTPFANSYSSFAELTGKLHQFHELSLALYEHTIILFFTTADRLSFHTVWTGYATAQSGALFLGRKDVAKFCCLCLLDGNRISQQRKVNVVTRRWREHFPTPPSPPRFATPSRAADLFPL